MPPVDLAIIGGGIVGLATAHRFLQRFPSARVTLVEKEDHVGAHQSSHNSGVLHSGIYYKPGSLKAQTCIRGKQAMMAFCEEQAIPFERCGKVIVAVDEKELPVMQRLYSYGQANGVGCEIIGPERLKELEPAVNGIGAIHVHDAGIADFPAVCQRLAELIQERGGEVRCGARANGIVNHDSLVRISTTKGDIESRCVVNCAGLYSDKVARLSGARPAMQIVPFRGEYFKLSPEGAALCRNLIYPVPDPSFPFLGVHFTRMIHGEVECGPNAVLAFSREGYTKLRIRPLELLGSLTYAGFLRMAMKHWRVGMGEMWRSFSRKAFLKALQRLIPAVKLEHLSPAPAGVRAQAVGRDGKLIDDFHIEEAGLVINVCNAPSPAATASLAIGDHIVDRVATRLPDMTQP